MKDLYHLNPKAYKEGYEILSLLSEIEKRKIPSEIWKFIKENMDLTYEFSIEQIDKGVLLDDTNILLAILYKTYLATEEEKVIIKAKERVVEKRKQLEAYQKYNPNNLFKN